MKLQGLKDLYNIRDAAEQIPIIEKIVVEEDLIHLNTISDMPILMEDILEINGYGDGIFQIGSTEKGGLCISLMFLSDEDSSEESESVEEPAVEEPPERKYYSELSTSKRKEIKDRIIQLAKEDNTPMEIYNIIKEEFPNTYVNKGNIYAWKREVELQTKAQITSLPRESESVEEPAVEEPQIVEEPAAEPEPIEEPAPTDETEPHIKEEARTLMEKNNWSYKRIADFLNAKYHLSLSKQDVYEWGPKVGNPPTEKNPPEEPNNEKRQFYLITGEEKEEIIDKAKELLKTMKPMDAYRQIKKEYPDLEINESNFYKWRSEIEPEPKPQEKEESPAKPTSKILEKLKSPEFKEQSAARAKKRKQLNMLKKIEKRGFLLKGEVDPKEEDILEELDDEELISLNLVNDENAWELTERGHKLLEEEEDK